MGSVLQLESFDRPATMAASGAETPSQPAGYAEGYAAGLAAAEATFIAEQSALKESVVSAMAATAPTFAEAQSHTLAAMLPLLETMIETLLPATLAPALHAHLNDLVSAALAADASTPLVLTVPRDQQDAIADALAGTDTRHVQIIADASLSDHAAWVRTAKQETALDLDVALAGIAAHIHDLKTLVAAEAS